MRLFALQGQTLFAPQFRSAQPWAHAHNPAPPRGVGDAAPYKTIRRASHYRKRPRRPGGRPPYISLYYIPWGGPSPATHSRHPVGAGHARPATLPLPPLFILCIVGRGLDRLTAHNERRQPAKLARSCGCLPCRGKHCSLPSFAPLNRGPTLTTPHLRGASGTPPPTKQSAGLLITANVRGGLGAGRPTSHFTTFRGAGLRPQLIHATL